MRIIEITESKKEKMSGLVEDMLMIGGKLMNCIEQLGEDSDMGERMRYRGGMGMRDGGSYGNRNGYGNRYDDPDEMGERRYYRR